MTRRIAENRLVDSINSFTCSEPEPSGKHGLKVFYEEEGWHGHNRLRQRREHTPEQGAPEQQSTEHEAELVQEEVTQDMCKSVC